ncbi:L-lysine 6-transaminase [Streptosporangium carneum]|uniref:L-lysine-epsilon aminotransferase n=1 Tax=Streptosporangium carneum TaxID=47481 RepID=A0A9W6I9M1_9ACTN|nr:L-lysine 6-transaminase [Streptosporangium carneum]GLK13519.1 L-lysine 6-transaminase [Streptosporangium carneum]
MDVHGRLARHLLVDGYRLVLDLERSRGSRLVDARTDRSYLDFYTFFASAPLGVNPFDDDPEFLALLGRIAANKPANSDLYTSHLADFTETFSRVLGDPELPHLFFVEGGALAVENALKCAFDWKSRRNEAAGRSPSLGAKVLHLTRAFHGRSGYTLSLTNTDPIKTDRFPMFDWPRIEVPAIHFGDVEAAERRALAQARAAFERHPHDIACFIAEPIQGEGGDNHMRAEFLQAMEHLCHEHDALFVMDEVQTGAGITGTPWAHQQLGLRPDIVAFAKKIQVGGVMAGRRVDLVPDNVFRVSGRINSTWGGGLVDMVRSRRMLEIIERDGLIRRAGELGRDLLDALLKIQARFPGLVRNARGRGLMCAFDLPDPVARDRLIARLRRDEGVLVLPCGERSVRLRPALSVTAEELAEGTTALGRALEASQDLRLSA